MASRIFLLAFALLIGRSLFAKDLPNVVFILADDLGYGDVGCYGADKVSTPNIDSLAEEGMRFLDAHSASSVCTPSRFAFLTGEYPFRGDHWAPVFLREGLVIEPDTTTLADVFQESGYATACVGKWHLGFGEDEPDWNGELKPGPLELGFDYYFGVPVVNSHPPFVFVENYKVWGLEEGDPLVYGGPPQTEAFQEKFLNKAMGGGAKAHALYQDRYVGETLTEKATQWIEKQGEDPFFLYYATTQIHHPFTPHPRFEGTSQAGIYGDFIHELDWIVGELIASLQKAGKLDNTIIVFTSDNGGMINMGGQEAWKLGHEQNGELLGFKFDAWEGGHRVPLIVNWPGKIPAGKESNQLVGNLDFIATFAELLEFPLGESDAVDSVSILPILRGDDSDSPRKELVLAPNRKSHLSLRSEDWMYIPRRGGGGFSKTHVGAHSFGGPAAVLFSGRSNSDMEMGAFLPDAENEQLYNLVLDLEQSENVIAEYPEVARKMKVRLAQIKASQSTRLQ